VQTGGQNFTTNNERVLFKMDSREKAIQFSCEKKDDDRYRQDSFALYDEKMKVRLDFERKNGMCMPTDGVGFIGFFEADGFVPCVLAEQYYDNSWCLKPAACTRVLYLMYRWIGGCCLDGSWNRCDCCNCSLKFEGHLEIKDGRKLRLRARSDLPRAAERLMTEEVTESDVTESDVKESDGEDFGYTCRVPPKGGDYFARAARRRQYLNKEEKEGVDQKAGSQQPKTDGKRSRGR